MGGVCVCAQDTWTCCPNSPSRATSRNKRIRVSVVRCRSGCPLGGPLPVVDPRAVHLPHRPPSRVSDTFAAMKANAGTYYIIVVEDTQRDRIVASGSLVLEKKFIHSCGQVRHTCYILLLIVSSSVPIGHY